MVDLVRDHPDDVIGALVDAAWELSATGLDRLALVDLLYEVQLRTDVLPDEVRGLVGDVVDALLGQCRPSQILRLVGDPPGEAALVAAAAGAAARWQPPDRGPAGPPLTPPPGP